MKRYGFCLGCFVSLSKIDSFEMRFLLSLGVGVGHLGREKGWVEGLRHGKGGVVLGLNAGQSTKHGS